VLRKCCASAAHINFMLFLAELSERDTCRGCSLCLNFSLNLGEN
jgi:hypothetical protein